MPALTQRFTQLWLTLGASGDPGPVALDLLTRWSESHRHYHTRSHLEHCLEGLDQHRALATDAPLLEAALWFHDAICDPRASDNELRSALLAREILTRAHVAEADVTRVERLILITRTHESDGTADSALLLDLDLAVLGSPPTTYNEYANAIRREYAWVPEADFRAKRAAVLTRFLERPVIFLTAPFRSLYEDHARKNLSSEIRRLR